MPEPQTLSEREIEILTALATGKSNKEIAQALHISANTVKVHVRNIFAKLEVTSRTEASMVALREGLIGALPPSGAQDPAIEEESQEIGPAAVEIGIPAPTPATASQISAQAWLVAGLVVIVTLLTVIAVRLFRPDPAAAPTANGDQIAFESRWHNQANLPEPVSRSAAASFEDQIYLVGGLTAAGASAATLRFDPESGQWADLSDKPTPVSEVQAAILGGRVFVPGGLRADGAVYAGLEIYQPISDTWEQGPAMPHGLSAYALAAHEGKLYVFGGWDGAAVSDRLLVYDPDTETWEERGPLPARLAYSGAAVAGGRIYLIGGWDGQAAVRSTWIYTPALEGDAAWKAAEGMPEGRYAMGVVSIADRVHVIGGLGGQGEFFSQMDYAPQSDFWQVVENPLAREWAHFAAAALGTEIYAIGGELEGIPTDRSLSFQVLFVVVIPVIQP